MASKSIYLGDDGKLVVRHVTERYAPKDSQSLINVHYSGINFCDKNFAHIGLNSFVTGFEFAGVVEQPGPGSSFDKGAAVCGLSPVSFPQASSAGSHQDFCLAQDRLLYAVPPGLSLSDAGGIVMACHTAADGLFNGLGFGFRAADVPGTDPSGRAILIWGGASSVGVAAIQMAKVAGFGRVFTTASPKNHAVLQRLGATQCFEYKSPTVVEDIETAAKALGVELTTAFDASGKDGEGAQQSTAVLARSALSKNVSPDEFKLVSTTVVHTIPQYRTCAAFRPNGDHDSMGNQQDPEAPNRVRRITEFFLQSGPKALELPVVKIVKGASEGIEEIERVARGGASLEKVVIEHPM